MSRVPSTFGKRITNEHCILQDYLEGKCNLFTDVCLFEQNRPIHNPASEEKVGTYCSPSARKAITADMEIITGLNNSSKPLPSFPEAGPRKFLFHNPHSVKAAIVTSGGIAPGLNCVVHSIVARHWNTYAINKAQGGCVYGIYDGFVGLYNRPLNIENILDPGRTERWLDQGGSKLGARRFDGNKRDLVDQILKNLQLNHINVLYVIGGDGSLTAAHEITKKAHEISVVGIPKTMDNDVLWVWQSFGFNTAVEKATEIINTMHAEAESTSRVCIIELFGAESGFVAANAALASEHVDLVLVPEVFLPYPSDQYESFLDACVEHLSKKILEKKPAHAIIVLAEGVAELLKQRGVKLRGEPVTKENFTSQLKASIQEKVVNHWGQTVDVFVNQPRHNIRAVPANTYDQIYCERLGALAVDSALAGYTDFMISQWLTEYVMVPLELVTMGTKSICPRGTFWKQVVSSTGQPNFESSRRHRS